MRRLQRLGAPSRPQRACPVPSRQAPSPAFGGELEAAFSFPSTPQPPLSQTRLPAKRPAPTTGFNRERSLAALEARKAAGGYDGVSALPADFQPLRDELITELRIRGWSNAQIAEHCNVSLDTINRCLRRIRHQKRLERTEQAIQRRLVPKAIDVTEYHLKQNSLKAAELVFKLFGQQTDHQLKRELAFPEPAADDTLEAWYGEWAAGHTAPAQPPHDVRQIAPAIAAQPPSFVEGTLLDGTYADHAPDGETRTHPSGPGGSRDDSAADSAAHVAPDGSPAGQNRPDDLESSPAGSSNARSGDDPDASGAAIPPTGHTDGAE